MPYRKKKRPPATQRSATAEEETATTTENGANGQTKKVVTWGGFFGLGGSRENQNTSTEEPESPPIEKESEEAVSFNKVEDGGEDSMTRAFNKEDGGLLQGEEEPPSPSREESGALLTSGQGHVSNIQRPAGDVRVVRGPNDYIPSESERAKVEKRLPEDTFSMIMIDPVWTQPFWYGTTVSFFQFTTYILVLIDVTDIDNSVNPFGFPANVDIVVRIAEVIALIILIPLQDEIIEGMILINDGYKKQALESKFAGVSRQKFILSLVLRLIVGTLSVATSFLLIMIESEVLEIFFNFIALQFINDLDNVGFKLAMEGIVGTAVQASALEVSDTSYFTDRRFKRKWPLFLVFFLVLAGWIWVLVLQLTGKFVSDSVEVQFGDDLEPIFATFSGIYRRESRPAKSGRFHYYRNEKGAGQTSKAFFGYCEDEEVWTFTYTSNDPCKYNALSAKTESYEISDSILWALAPAGPGSTIVPLDPFYMQVFEPVSGESPCINDGILKDGVCVCADGYFGTRCRFRTPCPHITLDTTNEDYAGPRDLPTEYYTLKNTIGEIVVFYSKPVYVDPILGGVVLFNGRRWFFTSIFGLNVTSLDSLPAAIENGIQLPDLATPAMFISAPSDIGTLSERSTPMLFTWYRASVADEMGRLQRPLPGEASAVFQCAVCMIPAYPCQFGNECVDGVCNCTDGSSGQRCQVIPYGNGYCNLKFNSWDFSFDKGDCCQASCQSTDEYFCGYKGRVGVGFPNCADNAYTCSPGESCWALRAAEHQLIIVRGGTNKRMVTLKMSDNGRVMVICYPRVDFCQLFDQIDKTWTQRGIDLPGVRDSFFGYSVALSTPHGSIVDFIVGPVDVQVAIGGRPAHDNNNTYTVTVLNGVELPQAPIQFSYNGSFLATEEGNIFFDFLQQGKYVAVQESSVVCSFHNTQNLEETVASVSCEELGIECSMGSFRSVSDSGSFLVETTDSELFYVHGNTEDLASSNWTATTVYSPSSALEWAEMSKDGTVIGTFTTGSGFQFFILQDDKSWKTLGSNFSAHSWSFLRDVTSLSADGLTATFGFSSAERNGQESYKLQVYRYKAESSAWIQLGGDISADESPVISSSYDASGLVVSDNSGEVRTFYYSPVCPPETFYLRMFVLVLKDQGFDWTLRSSSSQVLKTNPSYEPTSVYRKILEEACIPRDECVFLETATYALESTLDGLDPSLSLFYVGIDNEQVVQEMITNSTYSFGRC